MESKEELDALKSYKTPTGEVINIQEPATKKQLAEYNALAKKYNAMLSKDKSVQIKMKDIERLTYLYGLMSSKQKENAQPFPDFPKPPPPPKAPDAPPPPPPPKSPYEHIKEMAEKDATFYYNGTEISAEKAIDLVKQNKTLNIDSRSTHKNKPEVRISTKPIKIVDNQNRTEILVNGRTQEIFKLKKSEIKDLVLSCSEGQVKSFKIKIPKVPTQQITGNGLNSKMKNVISSINSNTKIMIFDVKISNSDKRSKPIIIEVQP